MLVTRSSASTAEPHCNSDTLEFCSERTKELEGAGMERAFCCFVAAVADGYAEQPSRTLL